MRLLGTSPLLLSGACSRTSGDVGGVGFSAAMARLKPLFPRNAGPRPNDGPRSNQNAGETYEKYGAPPRQRVASLFSTIRVVPIGPLSAGQTDVLATVADFMKPFFGLELAV